MSAIAPEMRRDLGDIILKSHRAPHALTFVTSEGNFRYLLADMKVDKETILLTSMRFPRDHNLVRDIVVVDREGRPVFTVNGHVTVTKGGTITISIDLG